MTDDIPTPPARRPSVLDVEDVLAERIAEQKDKEFDACVRERFKLDYNTDLPADLRAASRWQLECLARIVRELRAPTPAPADPVASAGGPTPTPDSAGHPDPDATQVIDTGQVNLEALVRRIEGVELLAPAVGALTRHAQKGRLRSPLSAVDVRNVPPGFDGYAAGYLDYVASL